MHWIRDIFWRWRRLVAGLDDAALFLEELAQLRLVFAFGLRHKNEDENQPHEAEDAIEPKHIFMTEVFFEVQKGMWGQKWKDTSKGHAEWGGQWSDSQWQNLHHGDPYHGSISQVEEKYVDHQEE